MTLTSTLPSPTLRPAIVTSSAFAGAVRRLLAERVSPETHAFTFLSWSYADAFVRDMAAQTLFMSALKVGEAA